MKKITLLCVLMFVGMMISFAQYDPKARAILDDMSEKIKNNNSYSADVSQSLINEEDGVNEKFGGKITVKGEKYLLVLEEQVVMNNGVTVWTYLPDVNEVNIDNYDPDEDEVSPSKIYDAYKSGYKYVYMGEESHNGTMTSVIDLVPDDTNAQFFKIKLYIAKDDLKGWTMFDKAGNLFKYDISNFKGNVNVTSNSFEFDATKYPGVEIIDLR